MTNKNSNTEANSSNIPDGWVETTLGEVCVFNYGKSLKTETRISGNIPVYGSSGITGWHNESLINETGLIIGRKGSVGTIYKSKVPFFPIDTVFYITKNDTKCDLEYLYRLLQSLGLDKKNSDSAVPGLNRDNAYSTLILTPIDHKEQQAIASVLSAFDDKIELLREQNKTLEELGQTIFNEWFGKYSVEGEDSKPSQNNIDNKISVGADSISARGSIPTESKRAEIDSAPTIPKIIQTFKRYTTIEYIKMVKNNVLPSFEKRIWQRNYYEHIIRDEKSYFNISEYIQNNPLKWEFDSLTLTHTK